MKNNLIATVSGGRSSVRLIKHFETSDLYKDMEKVYVFDNTGQERIETIQFLKDAEKHWGVKIHKIEGVYHKSFKEGMTYRLVDRWEDLDMESNVFSEMIAYKNMGIFRGLPNAGSPYCSEMMKTRPTRKFAKDLFGDDYKLSIGFRREDMPKRISWAEINAEKDERFIYPLITDFQNPVDNLDLNRFYDEQPFQLEIHNKLGNCRYCFKKDRNVIIENIRFDIAQGNYDTINWYRREQNKYRKLFFRNHESIDDLLRDAESGKIMQIEFPQEEQDFKCVCNFR